MHRRGEVHERFRTTCAWRDWRRRQYAFGLDRVVDRGEDPEAVAEELGLVAWVLEACVERYQETAAERGDQ